MIDLKRAARLREGGVTAELFGRRALTRLAQVQHQPLRGEARGGDGHASPPANDPSGRLDRVGSRSAESLNGDSKSVDISPRITANDPLTIYRLVLNGAGVGGLSAYVCAADIEAGRLVRLLPEWKMPSVEVNIVFPSNRELSPTVRAFVDFLTSASGPSMSWQTDLVDNRA